MISNNRCQPLTMGYLHVKKKLLAVLLLAMRATASFREVGFTAIASLANKVCPFERRLMQFEAASRLSCMAKAARRGDCTGVGYHGDSKMCYICDTYMETMGAFQSLPGAMFYRRPNALPLDIHAVGGLRLSIIKQPPVNYTQANKACSSLGALVKINTLPKHDAIRTFLIDPNNGFHEYSYWIQLRTVNGNAAWKFDDGTDALNTPEYWYDAQPDMEDVACGRMYNEYDFMWDDTLCSELMGYICELA